MQSVEGAQKVAFKKKCDRLSIKYLASEKDNLSSGKILQNLSQTGQWNLNIRVRIFFIDIYQLLSKRLKSAFRPIDCRYHLAYMDEGKVLG